MKWFKFAIRVFIAISVVPLVVLNFFNIGKSFEPDEMIFTKEVIYPLEIGGYYNYGNAKPLGYNDIYNYIVNKDDIDDYNITLSLVFDTEIVNITIIDYYYDEEDINDIIEFMDNNSIEFIFTMNTIKITNTYDIFYSGNLENLISIDVILTKPSNIKHSNIISLIISLAPIIFVGGVVLYIYKPFKKE